MRYLCDQKSALASIDYALASSVVAYVRSYTRHVAPYGTLIASPVPERDDAPDCECNEGTLFMEHVENKTAGSVTTDDKNKKTLSDWIGDMVALETHIEEALDGQLKQLKNEPSALPAVQGFHDMVKRQREAIKALQSDYGTTPGNPIIKAGSALLGKAAGVVDMIRSEGNSKSIRDDYTAFNLAAIGYTMLHTTATALGDQRVAQLAETHLRGYAGAIQRINQIISDVVVSELAKDDHKVTAGAADATRKVVDSAWKETDQAGSTGTSLVG